jgi:hypothetical protein
MKVKRLQSEPPLLALVLRVANAWLATEEEQTIPQITLRVRAPHSGLRDGGRE